MVGLGGGGVVGLLGSLAMLGEWSGVIRSTSRATGSLRPASAIPTSARIPTIFWPASSGASSIATVPTPAASAAGTTIISVPVTASIPTNLGALLLLGLLRDLYEVLGLDNGLLELLLNPSVHLVHIQPAIYHRHLQRLFGELGQ